MTPFILNHLVRALSYLDWKRKTKNLNILNYFFNKMRVKKVLEKNNFENKN